MNAKPKVCIVRGGEFPSRSDDDDDDGVVNSLCCSLYSSPVFASLSMHHVCVGNAGHALAALLPFKGYDTTMFCPYQDEAERIKQGTQEQGGYLLAKFTPHNDPAGDVKGAPNVISKHAKDVIPHADLIIMPMPSFAYPVILDAVKDFFERGTNFGRHSGTGRL
jgi:hypothetical protein